MMMIMMYSSRIAVLLPAVRISGGLKVKKNGTMTTTTMMPLPKRIQRLSNARAPPHHLLPTQVVWSNNNNDVLEATRWNKNNNERRQETLVEAAVVVNLPVARALARPPRLDQLRHDVPAVVAATASHHHLPCQWSMLLLSWHNHNNKVLRHGRCGKSPLGVTRPMSPRRLIPMPRLTRRRRRKSDRRPTFHPR